MTRRNHGDPGRRPRGGSPGVVLIIVTLAVLGLSILGAVVIEATRVDTATAGHVRRADQTDYVSEAGLMLAMREWAINYSKYRKYLTGRTLVDKTFHLSDFTIRPTDPRVFVPRAPGVPGSLGFTDQVPDFDVLVDRMYESGEAKEYSLSGTQGVSFCFRRYTFTAAGQVEAGVVNPSDSSSMMRATAIIGPTDCTL